MPASHAIQSRALEFRRSLLRWFRRHGRDLPWRRTRDPYHILVSEFMLQQTQVSRVETYYGKFLARYPSLERLAAATPEMVRESWNGLGYYRRAANLHRLAQEVIANRGGMIPERRARSPARVPSAQSLGTLSQQIWVTAARIVPRRGKSAWAFNQAIMELGALVCTARVAHCSVCPVRRVCGTWKGVNGKQ